MNGQIIIIHRLTNNNNKNYSNPILTDRTKTYNANQLFYTYTIPMKYLYILFQSMSAAPPLRANPTAAIFCIHGTHFFLVKAANFFLAAATVFFLLVASFLLLTCRVLMKCWPGFKFAEFRNYLRQSGSVCCTALAKTYYSM